MFPKKAQGRRCKFYLIRFAPGAEKGDREPGGGIKTGKSSHPMDGFPALVRVARLERAASCSQSRRPTNWATPGRTSEETRCVPFPPGGENFTSAPSFFLSQREPAMLGFALEKGAGRNSLRSVSLRFRPATKARLLYIIFPGGASAFCGGRGAAAADALLTAAPLWSTLRLLKAQGGKQ